VAIPQLSSGSNVSFPAAPYIPNLRLRNFRLSIPQFPRAAAGSFDGFAVLSNLEPLTSNLML